MKLTCPKCHAKSTVPDERVPESGAWARCPKCDERFYIRPLSRKNALELTPQQAPAKPVRGRSEEAQKLLDRLKAKAETEAATSLDGPSSGAEAVTVFPRLISSNIPIYAAVGVLIALVAFVLIDSFRKGGEVTVTVPPPPEVIGALVYGEPELRTDMLILRKLTTQRPHLRHQVNYSGYSSRVFKYFLSEMAPDECRDITGLVIEAERAAGSFSITATCLDPGRTIPEMRGRWEGRDAVITWAGRDERRRFTLFPLPGEANSDQQTALSGAGSE